MHCTPSSVCSELSYRVLMRTHWEVSSLKHYASDCHTRDLSGIYFTLKHICGWKLKGFMGWRKESEHDHFRAWSQASEIPNLEPCEMELWQLKVLGRERQAQIFNVGQWYSAA